MMVVQHGKDIFKDTVPNGKYCTFNKKRARSLYKSNLIWHD